MIPAVLAAPQATVAGEKSPSGTQKLEWRIMRENIVVSYEPKVPGKVTTDYFNLTDSRVAALAKREPCFGRYVDSVKAWQKAIGGTIKLTEDPLTIESVLKANYIEGYDVFRRYEQYKTNSGFQEKANAILKKYFQPITLSANYSLRRAQVRGMNEPTLSAEGKVSAFPKSVDFDKIFEQHRAKNKYVPEALDLRLAHESAGAGPRRIWSNDPEKDEFKEEYECRLDLKDAEKMKEKIAVETRRRAAEEISQVLMDLEQNEAKGPQGGGAPGEKQDKKTAPAR